MTSNPKLLKNKLTMITFMKSKRKSVIQNSSSETPKFQTLLALLRLPKKHSMAVLLNMPALLVISQLPKSNSKRPATIFWPSRPTAREVLTIIHKPPQLTRTLWTLFLKPWLSSKSSSQVKRVSLTLLITHIFFWKVPPQSTVQLNSPHFYKLSLNLPTPTEMEKFLLTKLSLTELRLSWTA